MRSGGPHRRPRAPRAGGRRSSPLPPGCCRPAEGRVGPVGTLAPPASSLWAARPARLRVAVGAGRCGWVRLGVRHEAAIPPPHTAVPTRCSTLASPHPHHRLSPSHTQPPPCRMHPPPPAALAAALADSMAFAAASLYELAHCTQPSTSTRCSRGVGRAEEGRACGKVQEAGMRGEADEGQEHTGCAQLWGHRHKNSKARRAPTISLYLFCNCCFTYIARTCTRAMHASMLGPAGWPKCGWGLGAWSWGGAKRTVSSFCLRGTQP
jgi:hypothetical protein